MQDRIPDPAPIAAEVARLRELVYDLGEAVTRLTAEVGALKAHRRGPRGEDRIAAAIRESLAQGGAS
jgi:hypothetical protein